MVLGKSEKLDESTKNKYLDMPAKVSELNKMQQDVTRHNVMQESLFLIWSQKL